MRIFLDTNILLDAFLHRDEAENATKIMHICCEPGNTGWIAWHTLTNGHYIVLQETKSLAEADTFLRDILGWVHIAPTSSDIISDALDMTIHDREDALQVASAKACFADILVTRNISDFTTNEIPCMTPKEFLELKKT